ncbi:MAG: hypothetical protein FWD49_02060 [Firmicutes bacterium]|nr:hypothetical protein [Bacillota bacterium]
MAREDATLVKTLTLVKCRQACMVDNYYINIPPRKQSNTSQVNEVNDFTRRSRLHKRAKRASSQA